MFTTFVGVSADRRQLDKAPSTKTAPASSSSSASSPGPPRQKRNQVARACDWCRVHRIKCDSSTPCRNCQTRGGQCSRNTSNEMRTLSQAVRSVYYDSRHVTDGIDALMKRNRAVAKPGQGAGGPNWAPCRQFGCSQTQKEYPT